MSRLSAGTLTAVTYVADHPRCAMIDLENHIIEGADLDGAQANIAAAIRAVLIQENGVREPLNLTVTGKGLRAIGRA